MSKRKIVLKFDVESNIDEWELESNLKEYIRNFETYFDDMVVSDVDIDIWDENEEDEDDE